MNNRFSRVSFKKRIFKKKENPLLYLSVVPRQIALLRPAVIITGKFSFESLRSL